MNKFTLIGASVLALGSFAAVATDITIFDTQYAYRADGWWGDNDNTTAGAQHSDPRGIAEDNETEPNTQIGQVWDLEAFYYDNGKLTVIGGFDMINGHDTYAAGDIFIDVDGDAVYGTAVTGAAASNSTTIRSNSLYGYDYVISFGGRTLDASYNSVDQTLDGTYKVYKLTGASDVTVSLIGQSNPWIYYSGGIEIDSGTVTQTDLGTGTYNGLTGGQRYSFGDIDLGFIPAGERGDVLFHTTMECGNDNLMGRGSIPDGGLTLGLFGVGLSVLGVVARRRN